MRKVISVLFSLLLLISLCFPCSAAVNQKSNDIVILFTNDVRGNIDNTMSYDTVSALKKKYQEDYKYVFLVDAGNHLHGSIFSDIDQGASIIDLMNRAGYDLAVPGEHDLYYGIDSFLQNVEKAKFPYISCDLFDSQEKNLLDSFSAIHFGKELIAFIGITTPETVTKAASAGIQDTQGNRNIYIPTGSDGRELYDIVQNEIDYVRRAGATKVVALGHLGNEKSSSPWTSREVIANVSGIDIFIDGYSYGENAETVMADKTGKNVHLVQGEEKFNTIGAVIIDYETGEIQADLISCEEILKTTKNRDGSEKTQIVGQRLVSELYTGPEWLNDYIVANFKNTWIKKVELAMKQNVGKMELTLNNYSETGERLVCRQETNTGDFAADALYFLFDQLGFSADAAMISSSNLQNYAVTGYLNCNSLKKIHTAKDTACLQKISGQQILDALEWGARKIGSDQISENFLQVSGLRYKIDDQWPDSTQQDDNGCWNGSPTEGYRVYDVKIYDKTTDSWKPLDLETYYQVAGYRENLKTAVGGFSMLSAGETMADYVMEDYMVLANYMKAFENQTILATNSPLQQKYPGFGIDYELNTQFQRIIIAPTEHIPPTEPQAVETEVAEITETTEEINKPDTVDKRFPVLPLMVSVASPALILFLFYTEKRRKTNKKKEE